MNGAERLEATVVIPTFNGEALIGEVLVAIRGQNIDAQFEILVIDSGSTDGTLEIVKGHMGEDRRLRLYEIPNREFQHGRTRNLAARVASGKYVAFLTQDATPSHDRWLEFLLEPFSLSADVKGVFGQQIPRLDADTTTRREVSTVFESLGPDHSIMIHRGLSRNVGRRVEPMLGFYSDVNSAAPRDFLLNEIPYEEVNYAEDQLYGLALMENNYCKAYAPLASVLHSNRYELGDYFRRKVDEFAGVEEVLRHQPDRRLSSALKSAAAGFKSDIAFAIKDKPQGRRARLKGALASPLRNLLWNAAAVLVGRNPQKARERFSLESKRRPQ